MRSNDNLYHDLIEQALHLLSTHEYTRSRDRAAKLRETIYLLDAHEAGQDITLAKLAYDPTVPPQQNAIMRLKHHLGERMPGSFQATFRLSGSFYVTPGSASVPATPWLRYETKGGAH